MPDLVPVSHDPFAQGDEHGGLSPFRLAQQGIDTGPAISPDYAPPGIAGPIGDVGHGIAQYLRWNMLGSPGLTPPELVAGAAHVIGDAAHTVMTTDPIDPATGTFKPEAIEKSTNLALNMMGPGTMFRAAPRGSVGMFAGPKSATADLNMLDMAQDLAAKGVHRDEIWKSTGWGQTVDGKWFYEIPDNGLRVIPGKGAGLSGPDAVIQHPALEAAYPQFKNMVADVQLVKENPGGLFNGGVDVRATDPAMMRWLAAHELQHPVQKLEGWQTGAGLRTYYEEAKQALAPHGITDDAAIKNAALEAYWHDAAEVQARNVERRLDLTAEERANRPPWETQGIPDEQQIGRPRTNPGLPDVNYRLEPTSPQSHDLPMDQASRFARAREMGFRTNMPLYHGTNETFDAFRSAPTTQAGLAAPGVSTALDAALASEFAANRAATRGGQPQVMPLLHRADKPAAIDLTGRESHAQVVETLRDAFDRGHDAVMIRNYSTPGGQKGQKVLVVRDPSQLRSPNAAFDPARKFSPNLLAGIAGMSAVPLGAMLVPVSHDPFKSGMAAGGRVTRKLTHKAVGYVAKSRIPGKHCSVCSMFRSGPACSLVKDPIAPGAWCRRFDKKD